MWNNKAIRYSWLTLLLYAGLIGLFYLFEHLAPSGPCTPGGGFVIIICLPALILRLFITSLVRNIKGHRHHFGPILIHTAVIMTILISIL